MYKSFANNVKKKKPNTFVDRSMPQISLQNWMRVILSHIQIGDLKKMPSDMYNVFIFYHKFSA